MLTTSLKWFAIFSLLTGCAHIPGISEAPDVVVSKIPVLVPCVDKLPEAPIFHTDVELKAMDDYSATIALLQDRVKREEYEDKLNAALTGCK